MSQESLGRFMQKVGETEELQARIGEEIDADAFIALGAEHGFEFSIEDLQESAELSDQELDGVAGGYLVKKRSLDDGAWIPHRRDFGGPGGVGKTSPLTHERLSYRLFKRNVNC